MQQAQASNWQWLENRTGMKFPVSRTPKTTPPLRVGGLTIQADPGSQAIVAEYDEARGVYVVLVLPDYIQDDVPVAPRLPRGAAPEGSSEGSSGEGGKGGGGASLGGIADAIVGIGGAAAEIVTGVGGWIASYFPKAGEAQGENQRRRDEALAQGRANNLKLANDVENYVEVEDARAAGRAAIILAKAQRKVMEVLGLPTDDLDEIDAPRVSVRRLASVAPTVTLVRDVQLQSLIDHSREIRERDDPGLPQGRRRRGPKVTLQHERSCCEACAAGANTCPCEG